MSAVTTIEWTDRTWNPTRGCSVISPGCVNCYAMKQAHRFSGPGGAYEGLTKQTKAGPQWTGTVRLIDDALGEPARWKKPARIFVNSMSDLFHESLSDEAIDCVFAVMAWARHHTYQILTKRPARMRDYITGLAALSPYDRACRLANAGAWKPFANTGIGGLEWPLPWIWLGVSAEDQQRADERIPLLLQTPAAVRFVSAEPLLGPIDLRPYVAPTETLRTLTERDPAFIDWVIIGGESGPGARPCDVAWVRALVRQCREADVACFVKQLGSRPCLAGPCSSQPGEVWTVTGQSGGTEIVLKNRKGGDLAEWPPAFRVRAFPRSAVPA
jgi:protein gp37